MKENIFAVYKPKGWSSYDVIRYLKKRYPGEKIGHGGTLDPLAEGILVIGVGRQATKKLHEVLRNTAKVYEAVIELGTTSDTDDAEGPLHKVDIIHIPTEEEVKSTLELFKGEIMQTPPLFSAKKIQGKAAYNLARQQKSFTLKPRKVTIFDINLISYSYPEIKIRVEVGSGTYIRSLARDIGEKLHTGAYIKKLKRTAVGNFNVRNAEVIRKTT